MVVEGFILFDCTSLFTRQTSSTDNEGRDIEIAKHWQVSNYMYVPYSSKFSWCNIFVNFTINPLFTLKNSHKNFYGRGVFACTVCNNHKFFATKIDNLANVEHFMKFLCHENLELYGTHHMYLVGKWGKKGNSAQKILYNSWQT